MKTLAIPGGIGVTPSSLLPGFCTSAFFLFSHHKTSTTDLDLRRTKKISRRHQRVRERLAFLERRNLVKRRGQLKNEVGSPKSPCSSAPAELAQKASTSKRLKTTTQGSAVLNGDYSEKCGNGVQTKYTLLTPVPDATEKVVFPCCSLLEFHYNSRCSSWGSPLSSRPSSPCPFVNLNKYVALDCEMVGTGPGGKVSELARCSIVNYSGNVVYDKYVRPELPVTDYRTPWSGIRSHDMESAIPFKVAQKEILKILKDKIVVGHALHNDFKALQYFHPWADIRDTSKIPLLNQKAGLPVSEKVSLKRLTKLLLHRNIQVGREGHSSVEDALASMELYRLVEEQWEQELQRQLPDSEHSTPPASDSDSSQYLDDQYWPEDLNADCK